MNLKSLQSVAESYIAMLTGKPAAPASRPKWVPTSITEENVTAFVQAVTEAANSKKASFEFKGKKYGIKSIKEEASEEDQGQAKKIQDAEVENAPKQPSDEVPAEVKEEDAEEIKMDNHDEKELKADEMPKLDDAKVEEELVGNQHKLDVNKNGKVDGDDLKKLRSEEKEEDSEEEHPEPDADNMGGPSDNDADNEDEDEVNEKYTAIVTRKNSDGSYDEVGMNNKSVVRGSHSNILKKANEYAKGPHRVELFHGDRIGYGAPHKVIHSESTEVDESTQLTGEQVMASLAATYASMVKEVTCGKKNESVSESYEKTELDKKVDGRQKHTVELDHRDLDKVRYFLEKPHHDQANKDMHNVIRKHFGHLHDMNESVEEGTAADAEAGPEVMDPATQKMKDNADDETEVVDMLPTAAQDGADKLDSAEKPAAANSSAALPKVAIVDAPTKLK